jgi:hypothetical protein
LPINLVLVLGVHTQESNRFFCLVSFAGCKHGGCWSVLGP